VITEVEEIENCGVGQKYILKTCITTDWRKKDKLLASSKDRQAFPPYVLINSL
jgi:hypothetical protein